MSEQWFKLSHEETPGILLTSEEDLLGFDPYDLKTGKHIPDWNPNAFLRSASPQDDGNPEDALADALGVPVFSARLREALHDAGIAASDLQHLPVRVFKSTGEEVNGYAFANVISRIAAVNYEHSFMLREDPSQVDPLTGKPEVIGLGKAALRAEMLIGHDVIRLLEYFPPVFVSKRFVNVFQQGNFTGAAFRPVPVISDQQKEVEASATAQPQHTEPAGDISPTELAKMLVSGVESLHTMAVTKRQLDATGRSLLSLIVRSFLTCYREAQRVLTPTLPSFDRVRPVTHAGVQGNSYHEIAVRLAFMQYEQILMHLRPDIGDRSSPGHSEGAASEFQRFRGYEVNSQQVEENWPAVAKGLSNVFADPESLSADSLRAEIDKEPKVVKKAKEVGDSNSGTGGLGRP